MAYADRKPEIARALLANNLNQNKVKALGHNWGEVWKTAKAIKRGYKPPPEGGQSEQVVEPTEGQVRTQAVRTKPDEVKGAALLLEKPTDKAAIQFSIGALRITMDLKELYDAYLYWQDMVVKNGLQDGNFCEGLKECVRICWEILNRKRIEREGIGVEPITQSQQEKEDVRVGSTS